MAARVTLQDLVDLHREAEDGQATAREAGRRRDALIRQVVASKQMTRTQIADLLGISKQRVSAITKEER